MMDTVDRLAPRQETAKQFIADSPFGDAWEHTMRLASHLTITLLYVAFDRRGKAMRKPQYLYGDDDC
jgi:hypothetical protein